MKRPSESQVLRCVEERFKIDTPLLEPETLLAYVKYHFDRGDLYLKSLGTRPSPRYLFDKPALMERARTFRRAFENALDRVSFYYAVKSNNAVEVSRTLVDEGFGLDVSSGLELELALGIGAGDIIFSGPGKTDQELAMVARWAPRATVLIDSFAELARLEPIAAQYGKTVRAGVRLTTQTGGLWRKFGIPLERLPEFFAAARSLSHVDLKGLQFHTSWNLGPTAQNDFIARVGGALSQGPPELAQQIEFVDIGGGYWPEMGEWMQGVATPEGQLLAAMGMPAENPISHYAVKAMPIEPFARDLARSIQEHISQRCNCRICLEPGRWLSNDAMHLAVTVVDKKAEDLVIVDAGTNAIGWERLESDYFPVLNLTRPGLTERSCHVLGSLCTPHDVFGYSYFGDGIEPGDVLLIPSQGAYTYSLRQHFIKPLPEVSPLATDL